MRHILGVNPLQPSLAHFFIRGPAGEFQPALVEEDAFLVRARHPDHDGGRVGHGPKPRVTFPRALLRLLEPGNLRVRSHRPTFGCLQRYHPRQKPPGLGRRITRIFDLKKLAPAFQH